MPLVDDSMDESTPWLVAQLQQRFVPTTTGLIGDQQVSGAPVWCTTLPAFERWFSEIESELDQTLGRRLAHAAAESEEWILAQLPPMPSSWFGQQKKRISIVNSDWSLRGLGQLAMLESSASNATLLVANRSHTALASGMGNAAWEGIQEKRFRFQWSDRGAGETVVELSGDPRTIPKPSDTVLLWLDVKGEATQSECLYDRARHEADGVWTVEGNRAMILHRDLLLRFETLSLPYLASTPRSSDARTEWNGITGSDQIVLWDAMAEAARKQFLASGELVLIASPEHWVSVSKRHLALQGLGTVSNSTEIDSNGGVELLIPSTIHPAILVGRLIGCWERAEGRAARATWSNDADGHHIKLESRREIAE